MVDITVRGAGIFGLSIAWICLARGATVQIIDPNGPATGSSGGIVGALAPHVPENWNPKKAFQLDSLLMADAFWSNVSHHGGTDPGYARTGRLQPIADDAGLRLAHERAQTARTLWRDHANWTVVPASGAAWEPQTATGWLIHDSLSAHLHPRRACAALVAALASKGVNIDRHGTDKGVVILATGVAGLETFSNDRGRIVGTGVKGQAALLQYDVGMLPQIFADSVHIIPHLDGTVAIGSTSERVYTHPTSTDAKLDDVIDAARAAVPELEDAPVIERWAGIRPRSQSRAPILGAWPDRKGYFIANGGFKIGFGMAPKVAETMADLVLEGRNTIPEDFQVKASL